MFKIQEIVGEASKDCDINEETAYNEDGLVVWHGRVAEWSKISGFVYKAYVQRRPPKKLWPPNGGHRVCCPTGSAKRITTASMSNGSSGCQGNEAALPNPRLIGSRSQMRLESP